MGNSTIYHETITITSPTNREDDGDGGEISHNVEVARLKSVSTHQYSEDGNYRLDWHLAGTAAAWIAYGRTPEEIGEMYTAEECAHSLYGCGRR